VGDDINFVVVLVVVVVVQMSIHSSILLAHH
jgi:hypothetical protein